MFESLEQLKKSGFQGFSKISEIVINQSILPNQPGVYFILYTKNIMPEFLSKGTGGYFKGKEPNVSILELEQNWVSNTITVYIGKATSLKKRLTQYIKFGQGKNIGHFGGRYIWQISNSKDLVVCWKVTNDFDPRQYEKELINKFEKRYRRKPFANLVG